MARAPARNPITGLRRRGAQRKHTYSARWMHLNHAEVCNRITIHSLWLRCTFEAYSSFNTLLRMMMCKLLIMGGVLHPPTANFSQLLNFCIHLGTMHFDLFVDFITFWFRFDQLLHDITPLEESRSLQFMPPQNIRLDDWDDDFASKFHTGFRIRDLREIYRLFGLQNLVNGRGVIQVFTGHSNQRGVACCYNFHPEELFLFFMTRMRKGFTIVDMCNLIFGGYYSRWSYAWKAILKYLDRRYRDIIGHQGLLRFRDQFPSFHEAIQRKVMRPKWFVDRNGNRWRSPGLMFLPCLLMGLVDCSIYGSLVPLSGPLGDYEEPYRKEDFEVMQNAFYTGFKQVHGIKVETVLLPNGISTLFGPVSCRHNDLGVQNMSGLNNFLILIQQNFNAPYSALGDLIYGVNWQCIRSYYRAYILPHLMTQQHRIVDAELRAVRQHIEFWYGKAANNFKVIADKKSFKLASHTPHAIELLRVSHLLVNIYNIIHGDTSSGVTQFDCPPPSLEEYLAL